MATINGVMCNELEKQLDGIITTLDTISSGIQLYYKTLRQATQFITSITPSPGQDILDAMNDLDLQIQGLVPAGIGAQIDDLRNMMDSCDILKDYLDDFGVEGISLGINNTLLSDIDNVLDAAKDTLISLLEYPAAVAVNIFNKFLEKVKIKDLIEMVYKLIICFDAVCSGNDYTGKINSFFSTLDLLRINYSGNLDINALYSDLGTVDSDVQTNIQTCLTSIQNAEASSKSLLDGELTDLKNAFGF